MQFMKMFSFSSSSVESFACSLSKDRSLIETVLYSPSKSISQ